MNADRPTEGERWLTPNGTISSRQTKFADRIYALFEDSKGRTWVGTKGDGLYIIGSDGHVTHCLPDSADRYSLNHPFVYGFDEDRRGNVWIATYGGGVNICQGTRFLHRGNELQGYPLADHPRTRRITHTADGTMIISSTTGLLTCQSALADRPAEMKFYATRHDRHDTTSLRTDDVMQALVTRSGPVIREYKLSEPQIVNEDEVLMDRLMAFIEQRIGDDALRIDDMAEAVNMGRTAFYEKIRQIVGVSPSDFLRQVRMQRARQLISRSTMNFSQIAYSVGFTDPKYFTKCFKKETGMTPSEYREKQS